MEIKKDFKPISSGGPVPKPENPFEPDCSFEDIFTSAQPISPPIADTSYIHEGSSFFALLFRRKPSGNNQKVA